VPIGWTTRFFLDAEVKRKTLTLDGKRTSVIHIVDRTISRFLRIY
jgi:hypothetical protein